MFYTSIIEHQVKCPVIKSFELICDPISFGALHPLIEKVEKLESNHLLITERIGGLRGWLFTYNARVICSPKSMQVKYLSNPKSMQLRTEFTFKQGPNEETTVITERIVIKGFFLFCWLLSRLVVKTHKKLINNIENKNAYGIA